MLIAWGSSRVVVLLPRLGVALKFAKVRTRTLKSYLKRLFTLKWQGLWREMFTPDCIPWSLKNVLFAGWLSNRREYSFYRRTRHPFCWPTTSSLFGLVNIQPLARQVPANSVWEFFFGCFPDYLTAENALWPDHHAFAERGNFCIDRGGYIRILDYGSKEAASIIKVHGHLLHRQVQPLSA